MELKVLLQVLRKHLLLIVVSTLIAGGLALLISLRIEQSYVSMLSIYVQKIPEQPIQGDYTYDGYYAQQAAESYTDTVVGLFESPAIISRALELAGRPADAVDVKRFSRKLSVEKVAPLLVDIAIKHQDETESKMLIKSLFAAVDGRISELNEDVAVNLAIQIDVVHEEPLVSLSQPNNVLNTLVGLLLGLFASITFVVLKEYLLSPEQ